jgi:LysR family glycine cleavage system transcriptional activator
MPISLCSLTCLTGSKWRPSTFLRDKAIESPNNLSRFTLLHEESRSWWTQWLELVGASAASLLKGRFFEETHLALIAAEAGQGLALGDDVLVSDAIAAGRLVRILAESASSGGYYLMARSSVNNSTKATAFADWLVAECENFTA